MDPEGNVAIAEAVIETTRQNKNRQHQKPTRQPRYHVFLWNDDNHSYEYVMLMLNELFGHELEKGFGIAKNVDQNGKAIVLTTTMEHAELKRDQIHSYGRDVLIASCKGSMSSTIEPEASHGDR